MAATHAQPSPSALAKPLIRRSISFTLKAESFSLIATRHVLFFLSLFGFFGGMLALANGYYFEFHFFFYLSLVPMVSFIIFLINQWRVFTFFTFSFLFFVYAVAGFTLGVHKTGLGSWRAGLFDAVSIENALILLGLNLILFCCVTALLLREQDFRRGQMIDTKTPVLGQYIQLLYAIVGAALLIRVGLIGRDIVVEAGGASATVGLGTVFSTLAIAATLASSKPTRIMQASALIAGIACIFASMNGYRYLLVIVVLMLVGRHLLFAPKPLWGFVQSLMPGSIIFCVLILIGVGRNFGYNAIEAVFAIGNGRIQGVSILEFLGGSEENLFFSFVSVLYYANAPSIDAYFDAILNVLPSAITSYFFETERVNDLIIATVPSDWFHGRRINLGAFFFTESAINLGPSGLYIATILLALACVVIDRFNKNNFYSLSFYLILLGNAGNLAYYGINSFLTMCLYSAIFIQALRLSASYRDRSSLIPRHIMD